MTLVSNRAPAPVDGDAVYLRIAGGARNPVLGSGQAPSAPAN
jgi:hypothetical protein